MSDRWVALIALAIAQLAPSAASADSALAFRIDEGSNINSFFRDGSVAAHLVLSSGTEPRILVAFPAGNSGVGIWFEETDKPVSWKLLTPPKSTSLADARGRSLRGIAAEIETDAPSLRVSQALLSSVRVLRDYQALHSVPAEVTVAPVTSQKQLSWRRDRLDGAPGYRITIEVLDGGRVGGATLHASNTHSLRMRITAATGETPLTPIPVDALLTEKAGRDGRARQALEFLSYREKYLAGSWRFNTYFGRDTLMSLALLAPALQPRAIESGIASVLERLSPEGEVAHEEEIGEFAVLRNGDSPRGKSDAPRFDYGMIDGSFLLPRIAADGFLDSPATRRRASLFLARHTGGDISYGEALVRNCLWVLEQSAPFAREPVARNLVSIKKGRATGQWRDSEDGLGGGRYPYDVNVAFVPASLEGIHRLYHSGILDPYLKPLERQRLSEAQTHFLTWSQRAADFFEVRLSANEVRASEAVAFDALALDEAGQPIRVMHSDVGFTLLFGRPSAAQIERALDAVTRPFPQGLWTPVGVVVANPAWASPQVQARFGRNAYHGTVVWSWQHAVLAAGLNRQLARSDLPRELHGKLTEARARLWWAIDAASAVRSSELWSWSFTGSCYRIEPFGVQTGDVDESNAVQLWSTVFLGIPRPAARDLSQSASLCR